ncbi:hypothetical protein Pcinc_010616 [Petrolisthes cinctipes]|uniref:Uncharacterized protein n=1 Tax=Petrolisthes cinctipes TaxID=88211 RepID=A0AAE1G2G4_PETCI|nr:hypothetical protein Pcinc_010616 [Petrolisthes cinctipes]
MELAPSQGSNPEAEESITQLMALPASLVYSPHPSSAPTTSRERPRGPTVPMTLRLLLFYLSSQEEASGSFFVEARGGSIHAVGVRSTSPCHTPPPHPSPSTFLIRFWGWSEVVSRELAVEPELIACQPRSYAPCQAGTPSPDPSHTNGWNRGLGRHLLCLQPALLPGVLLPPLLLS